MTKPLFLEDCYLKELDAKVTRSEGCEVELDATIFCYTGGGQPSDHGKIFRENSCFEVKDVRKSGDRIIHLLSEEGLKEGDKVKLVLDWERRYKLMKGHTAMHILSSIVNKNTGALISGGQIGLETHRIDFSLEDFDKQKIQDYVEESNKAIKENQDIKMYFMDRLEALKIEGMVKLAKSLPPKIEKLRIVEIGNIDKQADGGTHVKNTRELGNIQVTEIKNKGKNNRRIYFKLTP